MRATALLVVFFCCTCCCADELVQTELVQTEQVQREQSQDEQSQLDMDFETEVQPFLEQYCLDCHAGDDPEAGFSLEETGIPDVPANFEKWTIVLQKIAGQEMPPEDSEQPEDKEREAVPKWIDAGLANFDCTQAKVKPRTTVRRLNRSEYNNVIEDLFGLDINPAAEFPADDVGEGFDNIGEVLSLPPLLMEKYLDAAELITDRLDEAEVWVHVFPDLPRDGDFESKAVRESIERLAERAFRRPLVDDELRRLMDLYELARSKKYDSSAAVKLAMQAILVSPQFLFRQEETESGDSEARPLDDFALASRLSFFLWSRLPDDTLLEVAKEQRLNDPEVLAQQTRRMLRDPRSEALVENFVGQWLELRLFGGLAPDPDLFPTFDDALREAMVGETKAYFRSIIRNDDSVLELLDSDYTFVNGRLARHYGITGVDGQEFRRVRLDDNRRGGILTHASILTLTSNPTRTSPVKRGKWILDNILGTPPPPPPPNVPELEEGDELLGSLRERMQQHRENPSCAVCHRKMDALGFGFENFDAIGAWREKDGRYEIDPDGELPGKIAFDTPSELRRILVSNSREFTNCLTRKLLTYALGRALSSRDQCLVDDIVEQVEAHDHRFSELIVAITTSDAFRLGGDTGAQ